MGFRSATVVDQDGLRDWLLNESLPDEYRLIYLEERVYDRLRKRRIEAPSKGRIKRLITSAVHRYELAFFAQTVEHLSPEVRKSLDDLVQHSRILDDEVSLDADEGHPYPIHELKVGAGNAKIKNIKRVCACLKQLQTIGLPEDLLGGIPLRLLRP